MKYLAILLALTVSSIVGAEQAQISPSCEAKLIEMMPYYQVSGYELEFMIEGVYEDLYSTVVTINGYFTDESDDYSYRETHEVLLNKGTCDIERVDFIDDESM